MIKIKTYKIILSLILFFCFIFLIYFILFDREHIEILKKNKIIIDNFKNDNNILFILYFIISGIAWVFFIGIGTPITIFSGFFLGNITGTILSLICFSFGSTILYFCLKSFLHKKISKLKIIRNNYSLINKIKSNEFNYFLLFRLASGLKFPLMIQNILPIPFNMKTKNFFLATILGMGPSTFVNVSIGQGFRKLSENDNDINFLNIIQKEEIYLPIIGIFVLIFLSFSIKKVFFNND
tara:strand:+ start:1445 stop:2158 length:714 start_codon:yes stop_codon:yes gene_type:complete